MLSTILVPIDEPLRAGRAATCAGQVASATGASVLLLAAIADPALQPSAEHDLQRAATGLRQMGVHCEVLVEPGWPTATILRVAAARGVDLIAMATHVASNFDRWINGSTTDAIIRAAPCPVLVVPSACEEVPRMTGGHRLLVPLDGSALAETALEPACDLAMALNAELFLARVAPHPTPAEELADLGVAADALGRKAEAERAAAYLAEVAERLAARGIHAQTHVSTGDPVGGIERAAREVNASLVVMATHGRGGLARFLAGSVATQVMETAAVPVLVVPPPRLREAESSEAEKPVEALALRGL